MFQIKRFEGNVWVGNVQLFKDLFCRILAKVLVPIQGFGIFFWRFIKIWSPIFVKKLRFEVGMTDGWGNQNIIFCVQSNSNITIINCTSINLWNVKRKKQNFLRLFFVFCHLVSTWIINLGNILLINPRQRIHPTPFWLFLNQIVLVRNHYHLSPHHCNYLEELCPLQINVRFDPFFAFFFS